MAGILDNHIILSVVLDHLSEAADIAGISSLSSHIREVTIFSLSQTHFVELSFPPRISLMTKHLSKGIFHISTFLHLRILNLSGAGITAAAVGYVISNSKTIKALIIVNCSRVDVYSLISLFMTMSRRLVRSPREKIPSYAPLEVLDCWGIKGLCLDFRYQGKKEWVYDSFCRDNQNFMRLQEQAAKHRIYTNIDFCSSDEHNTVHDIRWYPTARGLYGLSNCELNTLKLGAFCELCTLRLHERAGNPVHRCRTPVPLSLEIPLS